MVHWYRIFFVWIFWAVFMNAQETALRKAFSSLNIYNYFDAKKRFYRIYNKNAHPAASYGLSIIYGRRDNPFTDYDSAIVFANRALSGMDRNFNTARYAGFEVSPAVVRNQINHLALTRKNEMIQQGANALQAWEFFLKLYYYAHSDLLSDVVRIRDSLVWLYCMQTGHPDTTGQYLSRYPLHRYSEEMKKMFFHQQLDFYTKNNTSAEFDTFLTRFPEHPLRNTALERWFRVLRDRNDTASWRNFIYRFPSTHLSQRAWLEYFLCAWRQGISLNDFLNQHAGFPFRNTIQDYFSLNKTELFSIETEDGVGIIDTSCRWLVLPVYEEAAVPGTQGPGWVKRDDTVYFVGPDGKKFFNKSFKNTEGFDHFFAAVEDTSGSYFIFLNGAAVSDTFQHIHKIHERRYAVQRNGLYALSDETGIPITDFVYQSFYDAGQGYIFATQRDGRSFLMSKNGRSIPVDAEWVGIFEDSLAPAKKKNQFGILKTDGTWLLPPNYQHIRKMKNNPAVWICFSGNNKGIFFDAGQNCVISEWEAATSLSDMEAICMQAGSGLWMNTVPGSNKGKLLNCQGNILSSFPPHARLMSAGHGYQAILELRRNEWNIYDVLKEKWLLPFTSSEIKMLNDGYYLVKKKRDKFYLIVHEKKGVLFEATVIPQYLGNHFFYVEEPENPCLRNERTGSRYHQVKSFVLHEKGVFVWFKNETCRLIRY